eukprot:s316_g6.t1
MSDKEELADLKAWVCAVQGRTQAENHPLLVKCLGRALCLANASTSRCERDFANLNMAFAKRAASPHLKELHVRVTDYIKANPGLRNQVVERAGQIWKEGFGPQRASGKQRTGNFVSGIKMQRKRAATWHQCCNMLQ